MDSFRSAEGLVDPSLGDPFQLSDSKDEHPGSFVGHEATALSNDDTFFRKLDEARSSRHARGISETTVTASSTSRSSDPATDRNISPPSTPTLLEDSEDAGTPPWSDELKTPPDSIRLRRLSGFPRRRSFSSLPDRPPNLLSPGMKKPQQRRLTAAIVERTCSLLLGPPAHLVALMLRIAAQIAGGVFRGGSVYAHGELDKIPGTWESSGDEDDMEDDYGIPLTNLRNQARDAPPQAEVD